MIVKRCDDTTKGTTQGPAQINSKSVQKIRTCSVFRFAVESYGSIVCRPERFIYETENKSEQTDQGITFYLSQEDKQQSATDQRDQLYFVKSYFICQFSSDISTRNSTSTKHADYDTCFKK